MPRHIPVWMACATLVLATAPVAAQAPDGAPAAIATSAAVSKGRIRGVVRDDAGAVVPGASVVAMGTTMALAKSDDRGQFTLPLPAGDYVLRASREGYISNFREPVRVRSSVQLVRDITLIRLDEATAQRTMLAAVTGSPLPQPPLTTAAAGKDDHPHNEAAWRLRHLTRTILRDQSPGGLSGAGVTKDADFDRSSSFLDWVVGGSTRAAISFFGDTDFDGQVNFVTTGALGTSDDWQTDAWSRGVAYVAVGAPVGAHGDWRVRGAMTPGDLSSWVLLGEYAARTDQTHAFTVGMSFGAQGDILAHGRRRSVVPETRSVGAVYGFDRWRVTDGLELEYGLRADRYDYVAAQDLLSPRVGARVRVLPRTSVVGHASQRVIGPGANEFLPPSSRGLWLPPERTFSTLVPGVPFRAEQVRHLSVGLAHALDARGARTLTVERFRQRADNQVATLFGLDRRSDLGHYYVATAGQVDIDGWQVGLSGQLAPFLAGGLHYLHSAASWQPGADARAVRWLVPSASRTTERLHDLRMDLDAEFPVSRTSVSMGWRLSSGFARLRRDSREPTFGARFDIELRQGIPYQPIRGGQIELILALRNLFTDRASGGSIYDELLTLAPPTRLMGGVQVRF